MSEKQFIMVRRILYVVLAISCAFAAFAVIVRVSIALRSRDIVCDITTAFNPATDEVTIHKVYRDGRTEAIATFDKSSEQLANPLQDLIYTGNSPLATSYDPLGMYASGAEFGFFEYNSGKRYGEGGKFSRDDKTGIMTVEFDNGVTSWVGPDGVIASAQIRFGYDFDDYEVYVAFYER